MSNFEGFKKIKRGLQKGLTAGAASLGMLTAAANAKAVEISQTPEKAPFADSTVNEGAPYPIQIGTKKAIYFTTQRAFDSDNLPNKGGTDLAVAETTDDVNWHVYFIQGEANTVDTEAPPVIDNDNNKLYFQRFGDIQECDYDVNQWIHYASNCHIMNGEITESATESPIFYNNGFLYYQSDRIDSLTDDLYASQIGLGNRIQLTGVNHQNLHDGSIFIKLPSALVCTYGDYNQGNNQGSTDCYQLSTTDGFTFTGPQHIEFPSTPLVNPAKGQNYLKMDADGDYWFHDNSSGKGQILRARKIPSTCNNGAIEGNEECDGANLNSKTCADYGFNSGYLTCKTDCTFDKSGCTNVQDGGVDADAETPDADAGSDANETGADAKDEPDAVNPDADAGTDADAATPDAPDAPDAKKCKDYVEFGGCTYDCSGPSGTTIKFYLDNNECTIKRSADCWFTVKRLEGAEGDTITITNDDAILIPMGINSSINNDGHCYSGSHTKGVVMGFRGTFPEVTYEPQFQVLGYPHLGTIHMKNGIVDLTVNGKPAYAKKQGSEEMVSSLYEGDTAYVDFANPITESQLPDSGADVIQPPLPESGTVNQVTDSGDGGGCSVCSATPGNVSDNTNALIFAAIGLGLAAARRRKQD